MIDGIGGGSPFDSKTFGAQVVSETLDTLNGVSSSQPAPFDKQTFGAAVVSKTMEYMNAGSDKDKVSSEYEFQKSVLSDAYSPLGGVLDEKG